MGKLFGGLRIFLRRFVFALPWIFLRRFVFALPLHNRFTDLIFPVIITAIGGGIIQWHIRDLSITVGASVALLFIVLFYQNLLYKVVYTHSLNTFFLAVRHAHPVTQKFAANLLIRFLADGQYSVMSQMLFAHTGPSNLKSLIQMLEHNGVALAPELYAVLLTKAGELDPTDLVATWDTNSLPIGVAPYLGYFAILRRTYDYMPTNKKIRIFIFSDAQDFEHKTNGNTQWDELLAYHRDKFKFSQVYYCYKHQLDGFRDGSPDADKNIDDFVFFQMRFLFVKYRWVIGREANAAATGKTFMISDRRVVDATEIFVTELLEELKAENQIITL